MPHDRIAELLAPFLEGMTLSLSQLGQIATYADLLMKWNAHMNLTAVRDPEEIISRHFGESLFAAKQLFPTPPTDQSAIDIGSGAGFPGLPLKIWNPALDLRLVESNQRKAVFLREVGRALGLSSVAVFAGRAEQISGQSDVVVLRAVERFDQIISIAYRLIAPKGRVALLIGHSQLEAAKLSAAGLRWEDHLPIPQSRSRVLLVGHLSS